MSVIRTEELTMIYKEETKVPVKALDGVKFEVQKGEFTSVVGPSGSGKTTLLNLVGGLDEPTSGEVWIDDARLFAMSDGERTRFRLRHIGFVFQAFNLIPVLTARENVEFIMLLQHRSADERKQRHAENREIVHEVPLPPDRMCERFVVADSAGAGPVQRKAAYARAFFIKLSHHAAPLARAATIAGEIFGRPLSVPSGRFM